MLQQMRDKAQNFKWILILVIASFLLTFVLLFQSGLGDFGGGGGGGATWAAKVAGREVTIRDLQDALSRQDALYRQMLGAQYDPARYLDARRVLDSLIDREILLVEADRIGIQISDDEVVQAVRDITSFQNESGQFDRSLYDTFLSNSRMTAGAFEEAIEQDLTVAAMDRRLTAGIVPSRAAVEQEWRRENESASIEYVTVPLEPHLAGAVATPEAMQAWFAAHQDELDAGPARQVRVVRFFTEDFQKKLEDEAAMRSYYDQNVGTIYTMTEDQRRASTIVAALPVGADDAAKAAARARAEAALARVRAGEDFAAVAREVSDDALTREKGGDLGPFYKGMQEPAVDAAVFEGSEGDVVGPLETLRGYEVVKITKGAGSKARPFEEVRDLVARGLYARDAQESLAKAVTAFQEALAAGKDLDAAAAAAGVEAGQPAWITRDAEIPGVGLNPIVTAKAFELEKDSISEPLAGVGGQVVVQVLDTRETSPRSFDEAKAQVEEAVKREAARAKAREEAEALLATARATGDLAAAAAGRTLQTAAEIKQGRFVPGLGEAPDLNAAAFETAEGQLGRVADVPDGVAIFKVTARKGFDEAAFEAGRDEIARRLASQESSTVRAEALVGLRDKYEGRIKRNEAWLASISGG